LRFENEASGTVNANINDQALSLEAISKKEYRRDRGDEGGPLVIDVLNGSPTTLDNTGGTDRRNLILPGPLRRDRRERADRDWPHADRLNRGD
jgi:hypothetical protein